MYSSDKRKKYKAIGINIYGGGFTLGVLNHFDVLGQWEEINLGKKTFDLNFKHIYRPLNMQDWPVKKYTNRVDFVYANPPCAPWSSANTHLGKTIESRFQDKRLQLTQHTMETALLLNPKVFISESVENGYNIGASHYDQYVKMWLNAGYAVTFFLTDAIIHGSPSARRRFHFIAHKCKINFKKPNMENFEPNTVRKAIGDIENKIGSIHLHDLRKNVHKKWMRKTPPGGKLRDATMRDPNFTGPNVSFLAKRFVYDSPSATMVNFNFVHPNGKRWITFREAMRLCTYPDDFNASTPIEAVDAVLPCVANYLAITAKNAIRKNESIKAEFKIIDWRPLGFPYHMRFMKHKV